MFSNQSQHPKRRSIRGFLGKATALCLMSSTAMAALVDSGPVNFPIPDTVDGLYFNVVTLVGSPTAAGAPGWDINPYSSVPGTNFTLWGATANTWFNPQNVVTGNYNLPIGTVIQGAAANFFRPGGANDVGPQFTLNSSQNFLGFRFANEANGGANHFGYIQVQFGATVATRSIVRVIYDNVADTPVTVAAPGGANTAPTLTYNPTTAAGVTFPGGAAGTANASIAITSTGAAGTGQRAVTGCAISGAGMASFGAPTTTPANGIFNTTTTTGSINLSCTRGASVATASLTCTETATPTVPGSPFTRVWALTCPAANAVVTPGTASGTTITLPAYTLPSASSSASLTFTSSGSASVLNCTTTGAGYSVSPNPLNLAAGVPGSVVVTYTGSAVGTFTGTLNCTTTGSGGPFTYPLSVTVGAGASAVSVPAMGSFATWILILSAFGAGLLAMGTRQRN